MTENRLTVMKGTQTLYLFYISGFCSFALGSSQFHLSSVSKTYSQAKSYCRETYSDLATVHNSTEMDSLVALVPSSVARAWIGLENGNVRRWHWSQPGQQLDFFNWREGEPQNNNADTCAAMDQHGKWFESTCTIRRKFVCHGTGAVTFVDETKSWRDAQEHCRGLSFDLISIHSGEENEAVREVSVSENVWIGLFRDPWTWSDGSNSSFRYWKPNQPNYLEDQDCVAAIFKDEGKWNDRRCSDRRRFICQGARKSIPTTTTPTTTQQTTTNLTTQPTSSVTFNFSTANQSSAVSTEEPTTANELTTPNSTALASTTSSTDLNNTTTQTSTLTTTQLLPTTTTQATTLTTSTGTSASTTTQSSTPTPTETESLPPGNLILIQENMTWSEALWYCREHHIDLVHIATAHIQGMVAEMAKNATSAHVWLGLQYTCKFNHWFWTKFTPGCYQNWAPGQGLEGEYECGVTGAIESTGRQQWVGLPETERLNFICSTCTG